MNATPKSDDATVAKCLQLGHGFQEDERDRIIGILDKLDHRLVGMAADSVRLELSVKDREHLDQKVTLEGFFAGLPTLVGTSFEQNVYAGVADVRDEVLRQLDEYKKRQQDHHPR